MKNLDPRLRATTPSAFIAGSPEGTVVVDVGCYGWPLGDICAAMRNRYIGLDRTEPPMKPLGAEFAAMAGHALHVPDDTGDFVVAAHVIEHLPSPVEFVVELARITRPGGFVFLGAPSELSAIPRSSDDVQDQSFDSFWDDPTHLRPYTPGALYRLAISSCIVPIFVKRGVSGEIPMVYMLARAPFSGSLGSRYVPQRRSMRCECGYAARLARSHRILGS